MRGIISRSILRTKIDKRPARTFAFLFAKILATAFVLIGSIEFAAAQGLAPGARATLPPAIPTNPFEPVVDDGDPNYTRSTSNTSGTADQWSVGTNWDAIPTSGTNAQLVFGNGTALAAGATIFTNNDIAGDFKLNILNFTYAGPASGAQPTVTVSGNRLEFISNGGTTPTMSIAATGTVKPLLTISNNILLTNNLSITASSDGILSGIISGGGGLTKLGGGTLTLSGANTYTGTTTVSAGELAVGTFSLGRNASPSASIASGTTLTSTGTLYLQPNTSSTQTLVSGAGTLKLRNPSSSLAAPDIYHGSGTGSGAEYGSIIASNVDLGTGSRFILAQSNRDDFYRYGGDLIFSGNLSGSAATTFSGFFSGGGIDTIVLSGNNSAFTGAVTLYNTDLILNNDNALTAANSVTFHAQDASEIDGLYLEGHNVTIGALATDLTGPGLPNDFHMQIRNGSTTSSSILTVNQDTNTTFVGYISDGPNDFGASLTYASLGLTKTGTGTLKLSGVNSYTGVTTISAGTLQFGRQVSLYNNTPASWTNTNIVVESGATLALNVGGTGQFTAANIDTLKALGTASGGFKNGSFLGLDTTNASGAFPYSSVIGNPNAGANVLGLIKLGTGTLTLSGNSSYTGPTLIRAGTLSVSSLANGGSNSNIGASTNGTANLVLGGGSTGSATLLYTGAATSTDRLFTLDSGTNIFDSSGSGAVNFANTGTVAFSGAAGSRSLTLTGTNTGENILAPVFGDPSGSVFNLLKTGSGTWSMTGSNSYTGTTFIGDGTLGFNSGSLGSSGLINFTNPNPSAGGAVLRWNSGNTQDVSSRIKINDTVTATFNTNGNDVTFASALQTQSVNGSGALTKTGAGSLTLGVANTYSGATTVNAGSLFVNNSSGSGTGSGNVTVNNSGTTLGGSGTISGSVSVASSGANLSPGPTGTSGGSTAILHTGALTLASGSNFNVDLNGNVAGSGYDQLSVTGTVDITGSNLLVTTGFTPSATDKFFILVNDGTDAITGTFANTTIPNGFVVDYFADSGTGLLIGGNDIALVPVPEPSTWIGGALALAVLLYSQRRRILKRLRVVG